MSSISWVIFVSVLEVFFMPLEICSLKSPKETSTQSPKIYQLCSSSGDPGSGHPTPLDCCSLLLVLVAILLLSSFNLMKIQLAAIMRSNRLTCVIIQIMWPNRIIIASKVNNILCSMQLMQCKFGETEPRSVPHSVSCQSAHIRKLVSLHSSVTLLFFSFTMLQFPLYSYI